MTPATSAGDLFWLSFALAWIRLMTTSASTGNFKVPVGIDMKGAVGGQMTGSVEPESDIASVVLIGSDGAVSRVAAASATDAQLRGWISSLS